MALIEASLVSGLAVGAPPTTSPAPRFDPAALSLTYRYADRGGRGSRSAVLAVLRLDVEALLSPPPAPPPPPPEERRRRIACGRRARPRTLLERRAAAARRAALGCGGAP